MRTTGAAVAAAVMVTGLLAAGAPASAAPQGYESCAELREVYPNGVGERDATDRTSGAPVTNFKRSNRLYRAVVLANPRLDRDGDRIACERAGARPVLTATPSGTAATPLVLTPDGVTTVTFRNQPGSRPTSPLDVSLEGSDGADFTIAADTCADRRLRPSRTCTVTVGYGATRPATPATATLTVGGARAFFAVAANRAPEAVDDAASVYEDSWMSSVSGNVLANDTDPDGYTIGISMSGAGTFVTDYGTLELHPDGSYTYTLDNSDPAVDALDDGQQLADSFTYDVSDGDGGTDSATLTITVNGAADVRNVGPAAVGDVNSVKEDTAPNPVTGNVLTNDSDADGHALAVTNAGTVTLDHGSLALQAGGSYTYTLDNTNPAVNALNTGQELTDSFTYNISDGNGGAASATLTVTINGTTDSVGPVAVADVNSVKEDTAPNPVTGNVLTNDSDANGDSLSVTNPGTFVLDHGALVLQANGSYTFTLDNANPAVNALNNGQQLTDTFTYNISDGHGGTDSATITITINGTTDNASPVVDADTNTVKEDTAPNPVTGNVLTDDSDPDGDTLTVANAGWVALTYGSLEIHADGSYTYTLDNANPAVNALNNGQQLTDSFTYTVSDGHGGTASTTLTIRVNGTTDNVSPVANADTNWVDEDATPNTATGNVLTNDSDADGDTMVVANATTVTLTYGSLVIQADGSYAYTLDNANPAVDALNFGQQLSDMFTYMVSDGRGGIASTTLTVTIDGTT